MRASFSSTHGHVQSCLDAENCVKWPTYKKWKVPGSWNYIQDFNASYDLSRTEFDRKFFTPERIRKVEQWKWTSTNLLYDAGDDEYMQKCSKKLLQIQGKHIMFFGDSTTDRTIKALAHAYEEAYHENPYVNRITHAIPGTNLTVMECPYPHVNATVFYYSSAFLTHPGLDSFRGATKMWAQRLPSKGPPTQNNQHNGPFNYDEVYKGTAEECPNCQVLLGVIESHKVDVVVVNGGAWFNTKKLKRLHPQTAFEIALTAFWNWAASTQANVIWYWRTTNTGHFSHGRCTQEAPQTRPTIDRDLSEHNKNLNKASIRILRPHLERMHLRLLDAGNVMYHRSDAHCGYRTSRMKVNYFDCLHYCWPGPWRWINYIFLKSLTCDGTCDFCQKYSP